jgi:hypothetical protein
MLFAVYQFRWRASRIRNHQRRSVEGGRFDKVSGPILLFSAMTFAVVVNSIFWFIVRIQETSTNQELYNNIE